jgi:hypothetical protein
VGDGGRGGGDGFGKVPHFSSRKKCNRQDLYHKVFSRSYLFTEFLAALPASEAITD